MGFIGILLVIMLAAATVSLLLSSWLQRLISGPILELGEVARRVSSSKDYTSARRRVRPTRLAA